MADIINLSANDLASMLCSRVCHDLINPVGAIGNGLQALTDPAQVEMRDIAQDLIANASKQALAKLEYARLAYGASSTAGTQFDTRECERVANVFFEIVKPELEWQITPVMIAKNRGKLLMNMLLIAAESVPRGGKVTVALSGEPDKEMISIVSTSDPEQKQKTLIPNGVEELVAGNPEEGVDARGIQPFYTGVLARLVDMDVAIKLDGTTFSIVATPK
ncbi:MAG: histidine phosphotransferase [Hyphomicrobiaceae bacterium]|nr:histidine phosphotransferase [Hyphomicrobiaceae bacterium]MCC0024212.1 histidine phosphotransferase [Hyphomicrobiaceae bacterium]